jgi:hypothetical protein
LSLDSIIQPLCELGMTSSYTTDKKRPDEGGDKENKLPSNE